MTSTDLNLDQLYARLRSLPIGHTLDYHASISSTMPRARALAEDPQIASGTIVVADEQTAGRGRLDRRWESPAGQSLLCSVILKLPLLPTTPALLPMLAGIAVVRAVEAVVPAAAGCTWLKWPNDVLLGATPKRAVKVAGILIETSLAGSELQSAILGIGVNVNQLAGDLPAVPPGAPRPGSLCLFAGTPVSRADLFAALCLELAALLTPTPAVEMIYSRWRDLLITLGRPVTVAVHGVADQAMILGLAVDVTQEGEIVVEDATGKRLTFAAADVSLRAPETERA